MTISCRTISLMLLIAVLLPACRANREGTIVGTVVPPETPARITARQDGRDIQAVSSEGRDGAFKLALAAGVYSIIVSVADSPYTVRLEDISVKPGETATLPPIELLAPSGTATLSGKVVPPRPGAEVKLIYEGRERAAVHADEKGVYEFKELPAGTYIVHANAPGHADDTARVVISEAQRVEQNAVLLPITSLNGVDWVSGKIRASGIGLPPPNAANEGVSRAMAKRAALASAQRNLLSTIEQIRIDANQDVKTAMRSGAVSRKVQGFLKGYTVVSERVLEGGKIEVVLELPLTGPDGLSRYIIE